jgi:L-threonylcarbamoyladenylate synthase
MRRRTRAELGTDTVRGGVVLALKSLPEGSEGIALPDSADEYARGLYSALRQLDARHASEILIEQTPEGPEWLAVNDRIARALAGAGVSP